MTTATKPHMLAEFFEVAVHQVLFARNIYPHPLFERRCMYGVPVWMSRHPDLNAYIAEAIGVACELIEHNHLEQFVVAIVPDAIQTGGDGVGACSSQPLERFVFAITAPQHADRMGDRLFDGFRDCLLKIATSSAALDPNPSQCSFRILLSSTASAAADVEQLQRAFIRADMCQNTIELPAITSLKSVQDTEHTSFHMLLNVEENRAGKKLGLAEKHAFT